MGERARRGRFGGGGRGGSGNSRGMGVEGGGGGGGSAAAGCACVSNAPLLVELKNLDEECLRTGKVKLRHGLMRAMKSLKRYPLPITTEKEACALEGVGTFTARRMMRGLLPAAPASNNDNGGATGSSSSSSRRTNEENIEPPPPRTSSSSPPRRRGTKPGSNGNRGTGSSSATGASRCPSASSNSLLRMNLRVGSSSSGRGSESTRATGQPLSLASNFAVLRGDNCVGVSGPHTQTPDVTPKRPTSRARREEVSGEIEIEIEIETGQIVSSKAPTVFSGHWEVWLLVDNREHGFMSTQSSLLQKGIRCETRQLPLGDMLWIARRKDDLTSEVLLGYIVERKTASDLASSIVDGRYDEQKRRLKLSGLRRRIYLVEGNLSHQSQLSPATLRTALASTQACGGLAVVQCDSLRDTVDFLARTHRHIVSLLEKTCRGSAGTEGGGGGGETEAGLWPATGGGEGAGGCRAILRPAMTYGEYAQGCAKRAGATTVRQVLGAMMRQAPGCSAARAEAIVRAFGSPLGLILAFERAASGGDGSGDDEWGVADEATRMKRVDDLLAGLVCRGGAGTNKLPQPLRRLLCRLFVGESVDVDERVSPGGVGAAGAPQAASGHRCRENNNGSGSGAFSVGNPFSIDAWDVEPMSQDDPYY